MNEHNDILKALRQQMKEEDQAEGHPFHVPEGYFPELQNKIMAGIRDEEETIPFVINEGKKQTFTVPDGYFDNLAKEIGKKTVSPTPVKKLFAHRWLQIAAAVFTGFIIVSGIFYWKQPDSHQIAIQNKSNIPTSIQNLSANELADFVGDASTGNNNGNDKKNSVDINQLFQQVSSQDLESFLNETAANNTELF